MPYGDGSLEQALALARLEFLKALEKAGVEFEVSAIDGLIPLNPTEVLDYLENPDSLLAKRRGVPLSDWLRWKEYVQSVSSVTYEEFMLQSPKPSPWSNSHKSPIPDDLRWEVFKQDNFTCQCCGARSRLTIDHIIPEAKGGQTVKDNLQTLCRKCNSKKGTQISVTEKPLQRENNAETEALA